MPGSLCRYLSCLRTHLRTRPGMRGKFTRTGAGQPQPGTPQPAAMLPSPGARHRGIWRWLDRLRRLTPHISTEGPDFSRYGLGSRAWWSDASLTVSRTKPGV